MSRRILATAYDYRPGFGGVATCSFKIMEALARSGAEVRCLAQSRKGDVEFDRHGAFETVRENFGRTAALATGRLSVRLAFEIGRWRPDAVLNFHWLPCGAASYLCSPVRAATGVGFYVFAHGNELLETNRTPLKRIRSALAPAKSAVFRGARAVFAVSHYTAGLVERECGVDKKKIEVVHNGVDCEAFYPASPRDDLLDRYRLRGKRVVIAVCRLDDYKGVDRAITSLARVRQRVPKVCLLICGTGPDRERLETIARKAGVAEAVTFAGSVAPGDLRDHYNLAECLVMPSRFDAAAPNVEGFGIVFLEAAACGLPVVGGRSGGQPDAVAEGKNGWLVDPDDDSAVAEALIECLTDSERAAKYRKFGLKRVREEFSWTRPAEQILARMELER